MKIIIIVCAMLFAGPVLAQSPEVITESNGNKILKGLMLKQDLTSDSAFAGWFAQNQAGYIPEKNALQIVKANKDSIHFVVFGGTWCGDSKYVLPKFYALADSAGISQEQITLIGVDRSKKSGHHLTDIFNVTLVPTIIIMKNGKEMGRVVEYGKYGMFDMEIGEIISNKQ